MTRRELVSVAIAIELAAAGAVFAAFLITSGIATPLERAASHYLRHGASMPSTTVPRRRLELLK